MPSSLSPLDELLARDEIRQLAYRYADALDRRDLDLLAGLYRPDARFGEHGEGAAACRAFFAESMRRVGMTVLLVANHLVDFDDADNARGTVWAHGFIDDGGPTAPGEGYIQQLIKYDDRYVRVGGEWRFTRRRHFLWLGWRHGEPDPLGQPPANWPDRQVGLGSIPYDDPSWQEFWAGAGDG
ncbi:MAG: nuclear transport factor 2 family protein [Acidimicrobiales bacterium]